MFYRLHETNLYLAKKKINKSMALRTALTRREIKISACTQCKRELWVVVDVLSWVTQKLPKD